MDHLVANAIGCPYKIGTTIARRYSVRGILGAGSMGWVLKVADLSVNSELIALKVLYPHLVRDPTALTRFRQEVVTARQLAHPHIVHVHDFEEIPNEVTFLTMEYIRGANLAELLLEQHGKGLPFDETCLLLNQIASGLLYAHQQGVVHRDLKPSNILLGYDGRVRVCDFGLAKSLENPLGLSRTGEALGSPFYMAPEQFRGTCVDQRADIYAFGILAYELVAGRPPFSRDDYFYLAEQHIHTPLPSLTEKGIAVPGWFEELVQRCCAKAPQDRPLSFADFLPQLEQHAPRSETLSLSHLYPRKRRLSRGTRRAIVFIIGLALSFALFEWMYAQGNSRIFIMKEVFLTETHLGFELTPLKHYLRMQASLLRPESIYDLIESAKRIPKMDSCEIVALIEADAVVHARLSNQTSYITSLRDKEGYSLLRRLAEVDRSHFVSAFGSRVPSDPDSLDPDGETPLTYAIRSQRRRSLMEFYGLSHIGAGRPNKEGMYPLHLAVLAGDYVTLFHLLRRYTNPSVRDTAGVTPLHLAVQLRDAMAISHFAQTAVDFDVRDYEGQTPLMYAAKYSGPVSPEADVMLLLLGTLPEPGRPSVPGPASFTMDSKDIHGRTALIHAAIAGNAHAIDLLVSVGADLKPRDDTGRTAADYAALSGIREAIAKLHPAAGASP